jgi:hypothetical protein
MYLKYGKCTWKSGQIAEIKLANEFSDFKDVLQHNIMIFIFKILYKCLRSKTLRNQSNRSALE